MQNVIADDAQEVEITRERYQTERYATTYKAAYGRGWTPHHIRSRVVASREIQVIRSFLARVAPDQGLLLDIPCGTGKLGNVLGEFPVDVIAADVSPAMLELARPEYRPGQVTRFLELDARDTRLDEQSIDVVVCLRLFQRLPASARLEILKEFRRVCRGSLVISYGIDSLAQRGRRAIRRLLTGKKPRLFHARRSEIMAEIESAGFRVRSMKHIIPLLSGEVVLLAEV